jgi:hypothetical protein
MTEFDPQLVIRKHSLDSPIGLSHRLGDGNVVSSLHCMNDPQPEGSHGKLHRTTKIPSGCGGMSAAGESRLCIVIAKCAGGSAHRRAGGRVRGAAASGPCAGRGAADVPPWVLLGVKIDQCPHSAEGDMRALNEGSGFDPNRTFLLSGPLGRDVLSECARE